ncbi:MAG: TetR/AcrR family transcriptional regulator [Lachnospiraceae bacterium]|jgi:AcrR family transcriptional regulator|nr:TetR/AcrR family transcriptional regulator [Lachnospiraceae bacterium]
MDNKENILECALHLFFKRGYDTVGVQEIAEVSGVTKPTLYYYFKSKNGLLKSLIEKKGSILLQDIKEAVSGMEVGDVQGKLLHLARAYIDFGVKEEEFYFFMLSLMYSPRENEAYLTIIPLIREQYYLVTKVFEQAAASLGNMNGRQEQFAAGFLGTLHCFMMVQSEKGIEMQTIRNDATAYAIVHQFLHGIYS